MSRIMLAIAGLLLMAQAGLAEPLSARDEVVAGIKADKAGKPVDARQHYAAACRLDDAKGCYVLGMFQQAGLGGTKSPSAARSSFAKACNLGDGSGCTKLGDMQEKGIGGSVDLGAARASYTKACNLGSAEGCLFLAMAQFRGRGGAVDKTAARQNLGKACDQDHARSCYNLSRLQMRGDGGPVLQSLSAFNRAKACRLGYAKACETMRENGKNPAAGKPAGPQAGLVEPATARAEVTAGIKADKAGKPVDARQHYAAACRLDDAMGCYLSGLFQREGRGGSKNSSAARESFAKSCKLGFKRACTAQ